MILIISLEKCGSDLEPGTELGNSIYYPTIYGDTDRGGESLSISKEELNSKFINTNYQYYVTSHENENLYNVLFKDGSNNYIQYFLGSRAIRFYDNETYESVGFCVRIVTNKTANEVTSGFITTKHLCGGDTTKLGNSSVTGYGIRPLVTLRKNIKLEKDPNNENSWILK